MATVTIMLRSGVVEIVDNPDNVEVILKDYDIDGTDATDESKDEHGYYKQYVI